MLIRCYFGLFYRRAVYGLDICVFSPCSCSRGIDRGSRYAVQNGHLSGAICCSTR